MLKPVVSRFAAFQWSSPSTALDSSIEVDNQESLTIIQQSGVFDADFYNQQLIGPSLSLQEACLHYLKSGAKTGLDPHPLFDTAFYIKTNPDIDFGADNPLVHFLTIGWREDSDPHPLFDVQYYLDEYKDVRRSRINPLVHFLHFGAAEHRNPRQFFDSKQYKKQIHDIALRAFFAKHLSNGTIIGFARRFKTARIKALFRLPAYLRPYVAPGTGLAFLRRFKPKKTDKFSPYLKLPINPLLHFLSHGPELKLLPFSSFALLYDWKPRLIKSQTKYSSAKSWRVIPRNLTNLQSVPTRFGSFARQLAKTELSREKLFVLEQLVQSLTLKRNSSEFMHSKSTIILVSHQAAYTGSPMLLLQIARALSSAGWECLLLLEQGGELENDFHEVAHVINFSYLPDRHKRCEEYLSLLFDDLSFNKPKVCLLNSLETGLYAPIIDNQRIKIITLIHEIVDSYSNRFLNDVFDRSQTIVFPSKYVQSCADNKMGDKLESSREVIIPNPLLEKNFGEYNLDKARKMLRQEINAPEDSLVVLACGSPDMRKGVDLFITMAKIIIAKLKQSPEQFQKRPVHFVWIGAGEIEPFSPHYFIDWDLRQENLRSLIHLLPPRKNLRPAFRGADVFVLPSRQDPFPIVVHNAMAAQLPIVAFENAGGVPEMVEHGGAKLVTYGNIIDFAKAVEAYLLDEEERLKDGQLNARVVAERFSFSDYFKKLETQLKTLAAK